GRPDDGGMSARPWSGLGTGLRPGLAAVRRGEHRAVRADVVAGVTVAACLVPQGRAYAALAGLAPAAGLWAAVAALAVYAVLGSSHQLSVGPEATTALMTAITIAPLAAGDPQRYAAFAAALALLVGGICLVGRVARLGALADLLSRPVLVGYLAGIALIMISGQLQNVTGVPTHGTTFLAQLVSFAGGFLDVPPPTRLPAAAHPAYLLSDASLH